MTKTIVVLATTVLVALISLSSPPAEAGSGCCSYHHGECGCIGGRVQCCDNTMSPSCRCKSGLE